MEGQSVGGQRGAELPTCLWACLPPSTLMSSLTLKLSESLFKSCCNPISSFPWLSRDWGRLGLELKVPML